MTNREYINTLSTSEFIERIVGRFWEIAAENKMDYVHYNQQNCYNDLIEWLDEEYDEQKEIKERKAKFEKQIEQIKESGIPVSIRSHTLNGEGITFLGVKENNND